MSGQRRARFGATPAQQGVVVGRIQFRFGHSGKLPAKVWVYGARWDGGRWRCSYPAGRAVCRKVGKPKRRVTMDLAS